MARARVASAKGSLAAAVELDGRARRRRRRRPRGRRRPRPGWWRPRRPADRGSLGQAEDAGAAHGPAEHPDLAGAGAQPQAGQQREQIVQEHGNGSSPGAGRQPLRRRRPRPARTGGPGPAGRLGEVVVQAQALERGALVDGGACISSADRQPVARARPGGQPRRRRRCGGRGLGGEAGEAERAGATVVGGGRRTSQAPSSRPDR